MDWVERNSRSVQIGFVNVVRIGIIVRIGQRARIGFIVDWIEQPIRLIEYG